MHLLADDKDLAQFPMLLRWPSTGSGPHHHSESLLKQGSRCTFCICLTQEMENS